MALKDCTMANIYLTEELDINLTANVLHISDNDSTLVVQKSQIDKLTTNMIVSFYGKGHPPSYYHCTIANPSNWATSGNERDFMIPCHIGEFIKKVERRDDFKVPVQVLIDTISTLQDTNYVPIEDTKPHGYLRNLSAGGALLETTSRFNPSDIILFEIILHDSTPIEATAEVIREAAPPPDDRHDTGTKSSKINNKYYGLKFIGLSAESERRIRELVFKIEAIHRKNLYNRI